MSETKPKVATFCYRCGRRVSKDVEQCWYCGAPTRRWIRKPKRCPFCGEDIRAEAVKCRHCGEFVDGRPRQAEAPAQQIIFVVDRNMFRGMADARLLAGQQVPPEVARALDAQTVRAIETGQPRLITQPGVQALPAPAAMGSGGAEIVDVEPIDATRALPAPEGHGGASGANLPALRGETAPAPAARAASGALAVGKALVKAGGWLARRALTAPPKPKDDGTLDAQARDLYRICVRCQTEILTADNYCYHCGMQYKEFRADQFTPERVMRLRRRLPHGQYLAAIVLIAACVGLRVVPLTFPHAELAQPAAGGLAFLIGIYGMIRNRGFIGKFLSLALAALAGAALWLTR